MTRHYPDRVGASDYSCCVGNLIQPIRSTTQTWVVTRHQYGISALVSQTSFGGETSSSVAKCRLFSQATWKQKRLIGPWQKKQNNPCYNWCHLRTMIATIIQNTGNLSWFVVLISLIFAPNQSEVLQIWVVTRHMNGISALVPQTSRGNQWWRRQMAIRSPQALHFLHVQRRAQNVSDTRETGDESKGTMGRGKMRGEARNVSLVFSFPPSFARKLSFKVRRLGTS